MVLSILFVNQFIELIGKTGGGFMTHQMNQKDVADNMIRRMGLRPRAEIAASLRAADIDHNYQIYSHAIYYI